MSKFQIVSILDRSGSMAGTEVEVVGAYNALIKEQKELVAVNGVEAEVTLVLFDHDYELVYSSKPINDVPELTLDTYFARGMTALYDAIGKTILLFGGEEKVIFFIETDGIENASQEFTSQSLSELIEKKKKDGWDFNFVGADLTVAYTHMVGTSLSIDKTFAFDKSALGYATRNVALNLATEAYIKQ